jgi:hypothetical protein
VDFDKKLEIDSGIHRDKGALDESRKTNPTGLHRRLRGQRGMPIRPMELDAGFAASTSDA